MSKATTAIVSLLFVASVFLFAQLVSAKLAANGSVSALFLLLVSALTICGIDPRRSGRWGRRILRYAAPGLLVLLVPGMSWASFSLTFQGLVQTLNTGGSITLSSPSGIVVDTAGNVYVVDTGNSRIVEVNAQGVASVLTITGLSPALSSPNGIAIDGSGNLYVADTGNNRVVEITAAGAGSVIGTPSVTLSAPKGVALDQSGDIFVADTGNNRIVEVTSGGTAAALAITVSSGTSTLNTPIGLAVGVTGKLYIADSVNNRVVTVAAGSTTGVVASILGGVTLSAPKAVAVDRMGNVFIADTGNNRIAEIDTSSNGTVLYTNSVELNAPLGVALDVFGTVYIADTGDSQALVVDAPINADVMAGDPTYSLNRTAVGFGHIQLGSSTPVTLTLPFTTGGSGGLGAVKVFTSGVQGLDFTSGTDTTCDSSTGASTYCTVEVSFLPTAPGLRNGAVVLYDTGLNPILTVPLYGWADAPVAALSPNPGVVVSTGGLALSGPFQVALDGAGNMYVGEDESATVTRIPAGGGAATVVALGAPGGITILEITGVAVDGAGNLFVGDHQNSRILVVTPGGVVSVLSITGLSPALGFPVALALDAAGNLYISDYTHGRIVRVSTLVVAGSTSSGLGTVIGTGTFTFAAQKLTGLAVDAQGNIYADAQQSSSVVKVTAAGVASTLTLPGLTPPLSGTQGVAVDAMGNVYVVDSGNSRIVRLTTAGVASALGITGLPAPTTLGGTLFGVTLDPFGNLYIPDFSNNRIVFVNVTASSLVFPNTKVGQDSASQTTTVADLGNLPLDFAADPGYPTDFSQPVGSSNPCLSSTSLLPGTVCNVSVQFSPQSVALFNESVLLTNNSLNVTGTTESIAVKGTGLTAGDTTAVAVSTVPTSAIAGQPITVTALVTDTAAGHTATIPTGGVTFTDTVGSTVISLNGGAAVTLDGTGKAILTGVTLSGAGLHTITANYVGVSNTFLASSNTATIPVANPPSVSVTTLGIAPGSSVAAGSVVTLTATVVSNSDPVMQGTVFFCDATVAHCEDSAVFGSAQLTTAGTAAIKLTLGAGVYSIDAVFQATNSALTSVSVAQPLTVTANASYSSFTTLASSGSVGDYTLTATVAAFGKALPVGTVSFLDASNGNAAVGTAALTPSTLAFGFLPAVGSPLSEPNTPANAVAGDFNNDGIPDVAVVDYETPTVTIFLGKGDGTFQTGVSYNLNDYGYGVAVGDFNGDGKLDLAVASSRSVSVLLGNGDGTFQAETPYTVGTTSGNVATGVVVGDFNGDGILDIAAVNSINSNSPSTVSILIGNGDGTFQTQVQYAAGTEPYWVTAGDFNGDGKLDLAVSANGSQPSVNVLLGNGDGSFQAPVSYAIGAQNDYLLAADFNKDGKLDLVTANDTNNTVSVFLGNGDGTFQPAVAYGTGSEPADIAVGDFNGDGNLDLAVTNFGDHTVSILSGKGDGTFQAQAIWNTGISPWGIVAGDFNGDGLTDLFVGNYDDNTDSVLLNVQNETATATAVSVAGAGTHNVLASYPGDASRAASVSATVPLIGVAQTTTTLIAAPNPALVGQSVTLTATVVPAPTGSPAGSINFYDGATLLGNGNVNSSGVATFSTASLPLGLNSITAVYSGNAGFAASTSAAVPETVNAPNAAATTTTLIALPNPAIFGQSVTLTATVAPAPTGTPAGSVNFYNGTTLLGMGTVNSSGIATFTTSSLPTGALSLTAVYSGNAGFAGSTSTAFSETVTAIVTTTTLVAAPNPAIAGQPVVFTATVAPAPTGTPTGSVSFYNGTTLLGMGTVASSGIATFTTSSLPTGGLSLTAVYSGDAGSAGSTSTAVTETVTAIVTTTTLVAAPNPAIVGQAVVFTATIAPAPTGTPAGSVSFYNGTTLLGSVNVDSSGIAIFSTSSLPTGGLSITAVYSGNAGSAGSTSTAIIETVTPAVLTTVTTLTASPNPLFDGQPATFTATVAPAPTGSPAGIISFYSGTTLLGTGTLNSAGVATFTTSSMAFGTDSITASYPGSAGFAASTSTAVSETVVASYTLTGPSTPVSVGPGGAATFDITVPPLGGPFDSLVTLSATGLPPGATATFNPAAVTPGSAGAPTVLTIQLATVVAGTPARDLPANHRRLPVVPFSLAFVLFGAVLGRKRIPRTLVLALALTGLGVTASLLSGCGGGFENTPVTPPGSYTVMVTGTSGSFQASTTVTLVVTK